MGQGGNSHGDSDCRDEPNTDPLTRCDETQAGHSRDATAMATAFEPLNRSLETFLTRLSRTNERSEKLLGNAKRSVCQCIIEHTGHHGFNGRGDSGNMRHASPGRSHVGQGGNSHGDSDCRDEPNTDPLTRCDETQAGHSRDATAMATAFEPLNRSLETFLTRLSRTNERSEKLLGNAKRSVCQCIIEHTGHHGFNGRGDSGNMRHASPGRSHVGQGGNSHGDSDCRDEPNTDPLTRCDETQAGHSRDATAMATAFEPLNRSLETFLTRLSRTNERSEKSRRVFKKPRCYKDESDGCIDTWIEVMKLHFEEEDLSERQECSALTSNLEGIALKRVIAKSNISGLLLRKSSNSC